MRFLGGVIPIVLATVQGCAAPLLRSAVGPGASSGGVGSAFEALPIALAAILLLTAAFVGGVGAALLVRRRMVSRALRLRSGQAAPGELEKLQQALDLIEDVMASIRGPQKGPRNRGE